MVDIAILDIVGKPQIVSTHRLPDRTTVARGYDDGYTANAPHLTTPTA